jgi:hypothetical protein
MPTPANAPYKKLQRSRETTARVIWAGHQGTRRINKIGPKGKQEVKKQKNAGKIKGYYRLQRLDATV